MAPKDLPAARGFPAVASQSSAHSVPDPVAIVGGGIVGLALALRFQQARPDCSVTVFEKEPSVGQHQSGHNSNVLHCGLYYKPGSLKARLAVEGIREMVAFCQEQAIPFEQCGKLVLAASAEEIPRLRDLQARGEANGLRGLRWLEGEEIREVEPHAAGVAALHVPEEGITDYSAVCRAMARVIQARGGRILTGARVMALQYRDGDWHIESTRGHERARFLFNCAGLHCDRVLAMAGLERRTRIVPFRGEYFALAPEAQHLVRHLIYPVPDPRFPFLGVHFTRMIGGGVEAGPNAVLATAREGYTRRRLSLPDVADVLSYPGFWRFLARYPRMSAYELYRSLSRRAFCRSLQRLVPAVQPEHLLPGGAGVRAQALSTEGALVQDFHYVHGPQSLHLLNAPSPAATASLAIARHLLQVAAPATPVATKG